MPQVATTREKVMQGYEALAEKGGYFTVRSLPYHSVAALQFDVVNQSPTDGVAYAVARRGQELVFFNYGQGDRITLANDPAHRSTYADTNLSKAKSTNGANDYVIEFVSLKCRGIKTQWDVNTHFFLAGTTIDPDVALALAAQAPLHDPTSIASPPELYNPFYLENTVLQGVNNHMECEFLFDQSGTRKLGGSWLFGEGGAASYLRTNGVPSKESRLYIPEGFLWARDGEPDSDFTAFLRLRSPIVIPISGIVEPYDSSTTVVFPTHFWLEIMMTVWGVEIGLPSSN